MRVGVMSWSTSTQRSPPPRSGRLATLQPRRLTPPHALIATATLQPPRLAPPHALIATATLQPRRLASRLTPPRPRPPHASPTRAPPPRSTPRSPARPHHAATPQAAPRLADQRPAAALQPRHAPQPPYAHFRFLTFFTTPYFFLAAFSQEERLEPFFLWQAFSAAASFAARSCAAVLLGGQPLTLIGVL